MLMLSGSKHDTVIVMRIATWNIGGGHKIKSLATFDYKENINTEYFISELKKYDLDVICLQESQHSANKSVAQMLADGLKMPHVFEVPMHPSHIDQGFSLSLAIISRQPFTSTKSFRQPYPAFELFLPNGQPAGQYDKYVQAVELDGIQIANTMTQPLEFLGHPYADEFGAQYAKELSNMFVKTLRRPLIFAGDFNTPDPSTTFADATKHLELADALPNKNTKPHGGGHLDCIFHSKDFTVIQSEIVSTESDHFLCWTELAKKS